MPSTGKIILGGYSAYTGVAAETAFITGIGGTPASSVYLTFAGNTSTWATTFSTVGGWTDIDNWPGQKCITLGGQVTSSPRTWTDVTGGGQDAAFTTLAKYCVAHNISIVRFMHEFNGNWYPWGIGGNDTASNRAGYIATWQHVWNLFNAVAPGYFKWLWNPTSGNSAYMTTVFTNYYPGDGYVDI